MVYHRYDIPVTPNGLHRQTCADRLVFESDGVIERVHVDGQLNNSEAKMLMMHEGRRIYVGASEPGIEYFDGYLASLRVYGGALSEAEVKKLAADEPSADVLVHLNS